MGTITTNLQPISVKRLYLIHLEMYRYQIPTMSREDIIDKALYHIYISRIDDTHDDQTSSFFHDSFCAKIH